MDGRKVFPVHEYFDKAGAADLSDKDYNQCIFTFMRSIVDPSKSYELLVSSGKDAFMVYGKAYNYFMQDFLNDPSVVVFDPAFFEKLQESPTKSLADILYIQFLTELKYVPSTKILSAIKHICSIMQKGNEAVSEIVETVNKADIVSYLVDYALIYFGTGINLAHIFNNAGYYNAFLERIKEDTAKEKGTSPDDWIGFMEDFDNGSEE